MIAPILQFLQNIALYDYFNQTFWKKVDAYGIKKMKKDVEILRAEREKMKRSANININLRQTI